MVNDACNTNNDVCIVRVDGGITRCQYAASRLMVAAALTGALDEVYSVNAVSNT